MLKTHFKFSLSAIKKIKTNGSEYRNFAQGLALVLIFFRLFYVKNQQFIALLHCCFCFN